MKLEELEKCVADLSPSELAQFRAWFAEFDADQWDEQIASDFKAGKFDELIAEARAEFERGESREL